MNNYYVYEWIDSKTFEPVYVGKGKESRCYLINKKRNQLLSEYLQNNEIIAHILHDNLTENEAFEYEIFYINEYKYIYGYDIYNLSEGGQFGGLKKQYRLFNTNYHRLSEDEKKNMSNRMSGEKNPMYKKSVYDVLVEKHGKEYADKKWKEMNDKRIQTMKNRKGTANKRVAIDLFKNNIYIQTFSSLRSLDEYLLSNNIVKTSVRKKVKQFIEDNLSIGDYSFKYHANTEVTN